MCDLLAAALCLVLVLEGLFLFASPAHGSAWPSRCSRSMTRTLRMIGGGMVVVGLVVLQVVR